MTGYEKMMLQGLGPDVYPADQLGSEQVTKLAGEAFNAYSVIVCMTAFYNCIPVRWDT